MQKQSILTALTLAALTAATLSTAAFAERRGGADMGGPMAMFDFAAVDADKDGKITPDEMAAFRAARVTAMDADKDGKISATELAAAQLEVMKAKAELRATRMIAKMDSDADGMLTAAEMAAGTPSGKMFARLDADKDGAISQAEMDAAGQMRRDGKHNGKHDRKGGDCRGAMESDDN